jgi:hypothetical protein
MTQVLDPRCRRFYRTCGDFSICVNIGDSGYVLAEHPNERYTSFYYPVYGKGKFSEIFKNKYLSLEERKLYDVQEYLNYNVIFQAQEDFHLIGFNTNDKNIKWEAKLLDNNITEFSVGNQKSYLLCLDGKVTINNKKFKTYDYTNLNDNKRYKISFDDLDSSAVAIFTKLT